MATVEQAIEQADIVYTPAEIGSLTIAAVDDRRKNPGSGLRCYMPAIDKFFVPARPGDLVTVMGSPSNGKSLLMQFWARKLATDLIAGGSATERDIVVYITWEMAAEELGLYDLAAQTSLAVNDIGRGALNDAQWTALQNAATKRATVPTWIIGHSIERRRKRPDLTLSNVARALAWIDEAMGFHVRAVFLDYLQQIQPEKGEDRRMQVFECVRRSKDMALHLGCPVILGVQAGRQVNERGWKLPLMGDGQESSNIEHAADKMLSVWYPCITDPVGSTLPAPKGLGVDLEVTQNLFVVGLVKQRMGPANRVGFMYVDPAHNDIAPMELHA